MAGKIIADQIEHSTAGSLDTSYVVNGSAKACVTGSDARCYCFWSESQYKQWDGPRHWGLFLCVCH
jgi:hypothetical protein